MLRNAARDGGGGKCVRRFIDISGNLQNSIWGQNPRKLHMKVPHRVKQNCGFPGSEGNSLVTERPIMRVRV